jgi:hypothetical protein
VLDIDCQLGYPGLGLGRGLGGGGVVFRGGMYNVEKDRGLTWRGVLLIRDELRLDADVDEAYPEYV